MLDFETALFLHIEKLEKILSILKIDYVTTENDEIIKSKTIKINLPETPENIQFLNCLLDKICNY